MQNIVVYDHRLVHAAQPGGNVILENVDSGATLISIPENEVVRRILRHNDLEKVIKSLLDDVVPHVRDTGHNAADREMHESIMQARAAVGRTVAGEREATNLYAVSVVMQEMSCGRTETRCKIFLERAKDEKSAVDQAIDAARKAFRETFPDMIPIETSIVLIEKNVATV